MTPSYYLKQYCLYDQLSHVAFIWGKFNRKMHKTIITEIRLKITNFNSHPIIWGASEYNGNTHHLQVSVGNLINYTKIDQTLLYFFISLLYSLYYQEYHESGIYNSQLKVSVVQGRPGNSGWRNEVLTWIIGLHFALLFEVSINTNPFKSFGRTISCLVWIFRKKCHALSGPLQRRHDKHDSVSITFSNVCSGLDQRKPQISAPPAFVRAIRRWLMDYPHKGPITRKTFHWMTSSWPYCIVSRPNVCRDTEKW